MSQRSTRPSAAADTVSTAPEGRAAGNESLRRGFEILRVLSRHTTSGATIAVITRESELPRSTVSRLLASLEQLDAVQQSGRGYVLGPEIERLAAAIRTEDVEQFEHTARVLSALTNETVMVAVPAERATARVITQIPGTYIVSAHTDWQGRTLTSPSSGFVRLMLAALPQAQAEQVLNTRTAGEEMTPNARAALLAGLAQIRRDGFTIVRDESEIGLAGIGAGFYLDGALTAMIAIYLPTFRLDDELEKLTVEFFRDAARRLDATLTPRTR